MAFSTMVWDKPRTSDTRFATSAAASAVSLVFNMLSPAREKNAASTALCLRLAVESAEIN
jgi:hypothetical protein